MHNSDLGPPTKERRERGDLLATHKIMHGLARIPEDAFSARADIIRWVHSMKLFEDRSRCETRRNFFSQRVVIPRNALPEKVVSSKTTLQLKLEYDKCVWGVYKLSFLPRQASHRV